jgi:hypothetical protein
MDIGLPELLERAVIPAVENGDVDEPFRRYLAGARRARA